MIGVDVAPDETKSIKAPTLVATSPSPSTTAITALNAPMAMHQIKADIEMISLVISLTPIRE